MHPSAALSTVVVDELVRGGVREAVLAPGSRSAPFAYALEAADRAGRLRLHVRIDERSAGFLALGLARVGGRPVPVVTTSGTAVANLHPAVLEAHHSGIPLVVLSADRPAELRGTGANQTTVQPGIFAGAVRWECDLPAPESVTAASAAHWRSTVCRALSATGHGAVGAAAGAGGGPVTWADAGPVHLNLSLRDPLAPEPPGAGVPAADGAGAPEADGLPEVLAGRSGGVPWTVVGPAGGAEGREHDDADGRRPADGGPAGTQRTAPGVEAGERTLVLLGDLPYPELTRRALAWAEGAGWPVVAEPFGLLPTGASLVPHGPLVAGAVARGGSDALLPERVVVVGRLTLFRELGALLRLPGMRVEQVSAPHRWTDPSHVVSRVHPVAVLAAPPAPAPGAAAWVGAWVSAGAGLSAGVRQAAGLDVGASTGLSERARQGEEPDAGTSSGSADRALQAEGLGSGPDPSRITGPGVAATVAAALAPGDQLVLGSSTVPRDLALALDGSQAPARVVANRGLAGIDGTVSTAVGAALAQESGRTVALMGDLTFLHDAGGLVVGPGEPRPDLTIVVVNDDGGGIFSTLEYGHPSRTTSEEGAATAERVFGTPHRTDLAALCTAYRVAHRRVARLADLADALAAPAAPARPEGEGALSPGIRVVEVPLDRSGHRRVRDDLAALRVSS